jgi:hypothetical protein
MDERRFGNGVVVVRYGAAPSYWNCSTTLLTLECTRSDSLAMNSSYPTINYSVRPGFLTPGRVVNTAQVSGGGDGNNANNSASDPTDVTS